MFIYEFMFADHTVSGLEPTEVEDTMCTKWFEIRTTVVKISWYLTLIWEKNLFYVIFSSSFSGEELDKQSVNISKVYIRFFIMVHTVSNTGVISIKWVADHWYLIAYKTPQAHCFVVACNEIFVHYEDHLGRYWQYRCGPAWLQDFQHIVANIAFSWIHMNLTPFSRLQSHKLVYVMQTIEDS